MTVIATGFVGSRPSSIQRTINDIELSGEEPSPIKLGELTDGQGLDALDEADLPTFLRRTFPER